MKSMTRFSALTIALSVAGALFSGAASAGWQDQLNSAANSLGQQQSTGSANTPSLSTLTSLLNGNSQSLSSNSMTNAAGIMQYCTKNNLVDNKAGALKDQLLSKLGLNNTQTSQQTTDYQQGLAGLLNTGKGQKIDLNTLGNTDLGKQVKTKACDIVLKQAKKFIA